jgi:hypothetical protein
MMNVDAHLSTRTHDYGMPESVEKGKEASNPLNPLQIEKTVGETMTHIPKGAFKKASHNPNMRAAQNYSMWRIWHKPLVQCLLWRFSRVSPHRENICCLPWERQNLVTQE